MGGPVMTLPSDALSVTVNGAVAPTTTVTGFGVTVTDAMRLATVKVQRSVPFEFDAVMVAEPTASAEANPLLATRTMFEFDDDQFTVRPCFVDTCETSCTESATKMDVLLPAGGLGRMSWDGPLPGPSAMDDGEIVLSA